MKKKFKIIFISLAIFSLVAFWSYNYLMHGGERNLENEDAAFIVSSDQITKEFTTNINQANKKYLEKAIAIQGVVTDIIENQIIIGNSVVCTFEKPTNSIHKNQIITVKGRVVGYDDLMGELKLDQCFINKN